MVVGQLTKDTTYQGLCGTIAAPLSPTALVPLQSTICRQADFLTDNYRYWVSAIRELPRFHRKQWEFYFILQALYERDFLKPGRDGIGFGVGKEPLPALLASKGVRVLASDQNIEEARRSGWASTNQHAASLDPLNDRNICDRELFRRNVIFREVDMNKIPDDLAESFDFCWSACCLEHLGSLQHGLDFIEASLKVLRPGGLAVHTTEFNMSSNSDTIESRNLSLYRRRDIEGLVRQLEKGGHQVEPIDWSNGDGVANDYVDLPPYKAEPHLRLRIGEYDCTSIGLIVRKSTGVTRK